MIFAKHNCSTTRMALALNYLEGWYAIKQRNKSSTYHLERFNVIWELWYCKQLLFFYKGGFGIKLTMKVKMPRSQTKSMKDSNCCLIMIQ